jgi:hypothetical protein
MFGILLFSWLYGSPRRSLQLLVLASLSHFQGFKARLYEKAMNVMFQDIVFVINLESSKTFQDHVRVILRHSQSSFKATIPFAVKVTLLM